MKKLSLYIKILIFVFTGVCLFLLFLKQENIFYTFAEAFVEMADNKWLVVIAVVLIPVNWALESLKWQYLASDIEKITFFKSIRSTLTGLAFGVITPHGLGDYPGRILHLKNAERFKGLGAVFLSRIAQFYITLLFGTVSIIYFIANSDTNTRLFVYLLLMLIPVNFLFLFLLFQKTRILKLLQRIDKLKGVLYYVEIIQSYSPKDISYLLVLSLLRYLVFTMQFLLILLAFNLPFDIALLFNGISFVFLSKSVIPTLFDLGVREASAAYYFGSFGITEEKVVLASLLIWFLNIFIPAITGLVFIFKMKIFTK